MSLRERVERALGGRDTGLDDAAWRRLEHLEALVAEWSPRLDLHGFRSRDEVAVRYFAEALAALPWVAGEGKAVEIGAGGGSPGLPLAIARPGVGWVLVESKERKSLFLDEASRSLGLENVVVSRARYEAWSAPAPLDCAVLRGVSPHAFARKLTRDLAPGGRVLWFTSARASAAGVAGFRACAGPARPLVKGGATLWVGEPEGADPDVSRETSG